MYLCAQIKKLTNMLVNFSVENFRSFRKEAILRMEATNIKELSNSVISRNGFKLLPVAVMYGANSSGKSNLLKAMSRMVRVILESAKLNPKDSLNYEPFALDTSSSQLPTSFEIQFIINDSKYRYGFDYNKTAIVNEWLYKETAKGKEVELFLRAEDEYEISDKYFEEGIGKEKSTPANRLFISVVAQLNGEISQEILEWFENFNAIDGADTERYESITLEMLHDKKDGYDNALSFFRKLQLGFNNIVIEDKQLTPDILESLKDAPETVRKKILQGFEKGEVVESITIHNIYNEKGNVIGEKSFSKDKMESEGTKKLIELSGPIFDTLYYGKVLVVDEFDAKWHPILTRNVVKLFMDPEINKKGAQLIFATHDTNLLSVNHFRRDQIWFTEKDQCDSTDLYSLVEFKYDNGKKVRNDSSIEKDYINGRYGAIPYIGGIKYGQEQITTIEA